MKNCPDTPNNRLATERKIRANRENARKSTGPKTLRGKKFSSNNAVKHGLLVRRITDFEALDEDPQEYETLLSGLWKQYQPVGKGEEIEVERIALCWWKLKRAWRYENAVNLAARRDFVRADLNEQHEYCKERDKEGEALIVQLESAKREIEDTGEISPELKQRMFGMMPGFESLWLALEKAAQQHMEEAGLSKHFRKPATRASLLNTYVVTSAIMLHQQLSDRRLTNVREIALGRHAIPSDGALNRILRYEASIERSLSRAIDRLENLQRYRSGQPGPPTVRVRVLR